MEALMEFRVVENSPDLTHVALKGKLDLDGEAAIGEEFRDMVRDRRTSFLVDMSETSYLASLGIRLLFVAAKTLNEWGLLLVVLNPTPLVEETLRNSGTAKLIRIAHSPEEAEQLLISPKPAAPPE
jgi:stage II sporulation protein AA (anti-sigma F factor antagonist)